VKATSAAVSGCPLPLGFVGDGEVHTLRPARPPLGGQADARLVVISLARKPTSSRS